MLNMFYAILKTGDNMTNKGYFTIVPYQGVRYYLKHSEDYSKFLFFTKNEQGEDIFVGDEKNNELNEAFKIDRNRTDSLGKSKV